MSAETRTRLYWLLSPTFSTSDGVRLPVSVFNFLSISMQVAVYANSTHTGPLYLHHSQK